MKDEGGKIVPGGGWDKGKGQQVKDNMTPLGPMKLATKSGPWRKSGGGEEEGLNPEDLRARLFVLLSTRPWEAIKEFNYKCPSSYSD